MVMGQIRLRVQVLCFLVTQLDTQYGVICWLGGHNLDITWYCTTNQNKTLWPSCLRNVGHTDTKISTWWGRANFKITSNFIFVDDEANKTCLCYSNKHCEVIVEMKCNTPLNVEVGVWSSGVSPSHIIQGPQY